MSIVAFGLLASTAAMFSDSGSTSCGDGGASDGGGSCDGGGSH
jgi:hypothetical protein